MAIRTTFAIGCTKAWHDHYKLYMEWDGGAGERVPAWAEYVVQDPETHLYSAVVWHPERPYEWRSPRVVLNGVPLMIYEARGYGH